MGPSIAILGTRGYPSYYGGFETLVRKLAPYLVDSGWDVTVYGRPGATKIDDPMLDTRVQAVETCGIESKSLSTLSYGLTSALHVLREKPDVALVMNVANGYWLPLLRARGIPTVVNVDGIEWERAKWGANAKRVFRGGAKLTAKFATELVCDAQEIRRRWQDDFGRDGNFIPYGGEEQGLLPVVAGLSSRNYILIVARFVPENSVPQFIEAARELSQKWNVVFVGSSGYGGEIEEAVENLSTESQRVIWLGHVSDDKKLFSLWQHAGVYFHGHSVGGTNPALVQAMACGAPVLARDTVYNREVLGECGKFTAPEPSKIVSAVTEMMENRDAIEDYSGHLRQRANKYYSWKGVCSSYETQLRAQVYGPKASDIELQ